MRDSYTAAEFVKGMNVMRIDVEQRIAKWLREQKENQMTMEGAATLIETGEYRDD